MNYSFRFGQGLDTTSTKMDDKRNYLPDCWLDDKRMEVLFGPFRVRDTNPDGWDLKMVFWVNAINQWCQSQSRITFTIPDVMTAFQRGDQKPSVECLKLVMSHMKREQKVLYDDELPFRNQKSISKKALEWTVSSLVKPFSLAWGAISHDGSDPNEKPLPSLTVETVFFHKETMDMLLVSAQKWAQSLPQGCVRFEAFHELINAQLFTEQPVNASTLNVIIDALESKNLLKTVTEADIRVVKYGKDCQIKDTDISLIKLDVCKEVLVKEVVILEAEIEKLQANARSALESKNRDRAMLFLKKKKRIEKKLHDKETQIENIEDLHSKIFDSHSTQAIIGAFQAANDVLKVNSTLLDQIEDTVSSVTESLDDIAALNAELNRPLSADNVEIEVDAEDELNELLKDIEEEKAAEAAEAKAKADAAKLKEEEALIKDLTDITIIDSELSSLSPLNQTAEEDTKKPEELPKVPEDLPKIPEGWSKPGGAKVPDEPMLA